jgi:hypothetical protein
MIKMIGMTTTVENGKNGKGAIAVWASEGKLRLRPLTSISDVSINQRPTEEEIEEIPTIDIIFHETSSIDVYIRALEHIKNQILNQMQYALAC